jgi:hypothetical protein
MTLVPIPSLVPSSKKTKMAKVLLSSSTILAARILRARVLNSTVLALSSLICEEINRV